MKLLLIREEKTTKSTIGKLYINGKFECYTLEDIERIQKVYGESAIPIGVYKIIISYSIKFKKELPLLLDVPGFLGIRIHSGNKAEDTEGCILVGKTKTKDWIGNSRVAFNTLFEKLEIAYDKDEDIEIEIK